MKTFFAEWLKKLSMVRAIASQKIADLPRADALGMFPLWKIQERVQVFLGGIIQNDYGERHG